MSNLSPWFTHFEHPEREGLYQVKNWIGYIKYAEWFNGKWRNPETHAHIENWLICGWRGEVR